MYVNMYVYLCVRTCMWVKVISCCGTTFAVLHDFSSSISYVPFAKQPFVCAGLF